MVGGQSTEVVNALGWPGLMDTYRVDFRVPTGIAGAEARIPVQ